ncbi:trypsin-like serine peptidase [Streptomyces alkaliphilus]|uniref:trypsin-like serine peptidase n=1 Tax=Streptomyces alkaliphilus TaxID=1472722 RepID=UPI0011812999|nr:hypothetical protein [Streptomyces alkaliphilus]MQS05693.1 hypothetical protein [Streptomyces alkaliphilus]
MAWIGGRSAGRRRGAVATAAATVLLLGLTACGPDDTDTTDDNAGGDEAKNPVESVPREDRLRDLLDNLPIEIDPELWEQGEWANWDSDTWLREAGQYISVIIEDFWDADRMREALDRERAIDEDEIDEPATPEPEAPADNPDADRGITDPQPAVVQARPATTPYSANSPAIGKVFMETPAGSMVCSGAVVTDPDNPGRSNLVATAGHCVHAGRDGGWFRQIIFVPAYNDQGHSLAENPDPAFEELAPYGTFWAELVATTDYWVEQGTEEGGNGAHQDFAMMRVSAEDGSGRSLEETVGAAYDISFDAPAVSGIGGIDVVGYPAADPYDGQGMFVCSDEPGRLSLDSAEPVMYRVGCTMTGGASGGPWLATGANGTQELISVTSIGPFDSTWLAGPRLEAEAREVFDEIRAG